jgi:hypothetical protein
MPTYTLPNTQTGGSQTVTAGSLDAAKQSAQAAGTWSPAAGTYGANSIVGGGGAAGGGGGGGGGSAQQLGAGIDALLAARASGDQRSLDETIREFNATFGLDQDKFREAIRQFNEGLQISQAGLTGTYQGQPTQQALAQLAGFRGFYGGQPTMAEQTNAAQIAASQAGLTGYYQAPTGYSWNTLSNAIHQAAGAAYNDQAAKQTFTSLTGQDPSHFNGQVGVTLTPDQISAIAAAGGAHPGAIAGSGQGQMTQSMQQQQYEQQLGLIKQAADLQANPFRQQQALGQMSRMLGGQSVAGFAAPNTVAGVGTAGGNQQGGMGYLQQMIDDIRNPGANQTQMNDVLGAIPTPTKLNSVDFLNSAPSTQSMVLQGMQEKYGLDPNDALQQIKNTLPQFTAPTTLGTVRR